MKPYPTIPKSPSGRATKFYVFDKNDGSNIRVEWTKKKGFHKFGSRKRLLGSDQGILGKAISLAEKVEKNFSYTLGVEARLERATCFFEFHGPNSFAGSHSADDTHRLTLIDVHVCKSGMMTPKDFTKTFYNGVFDVPNYLGRRFVDAAFRELVEAGNVPGMTFEGVVCKAKPDRKHGNANMFKIKNKAWIEKVKAQYDSSRWNELL